MIKSEEHLRGSRGALPGSRYNALDALNLTKGLGELSLRGFETINAFPEKEISRSIQRIPVFCIS